jgi:hypothetical protein
MPANNLAETGPWKTDIFEICLTAHPGYGCFRAETSDILENVFKFWNQTNLSQFLSIRLEQL